MSKQEVIRKAWGVHFANDVDENGFRISNVGSLGWDSKYFDIIELGSFEYLIRPKSLRGIESNNGWIVADIMNLPIEGVYQVGKFLDDGTFRYGIDEVEWYDLREYLVDFGFTHYQPITKPLKPIY
ncbi:hypothetical protein [Sphingobacterium kyonggiense]